jgi:hypothetical protein
LDSAHSKAEEIRDRSPDLNGVKRLQYMAESFQPAALLQRYGFAGKPRDREIEPR